MYRITLLGFIGDDLDWGLACLLEPLGDAIKASSSRIAEVEAKYGDSIEVDWAADDKIPLIEDLLGIAFVGCQAYISQVVSWLIRVHKMTKRDHAVTLTAYFADRDH